MKKIMCECEFCIYNQKNQCVTDNISISPLGGCEACVTVDIPEELLASIKQKVLDKFAKIHAAWEKDKC